MWEDNNRIYPVAELNSLIKTLLEQHIPLIWVKGEVSNFTRAASGHWYFSLKDQDAQIRCVMFRFKNQLVLHNISNGSQVEVLASPTLYEARGDLQLTVEQIRLAGVGSLFERFELLKQQLLAQGWFAAERKRPLPPMPRRIGVITSPQAAALRDVLTTLKRRYPNIPIILYPTPVQGSGSELKIAAAIQLANQRNEADVLILCRGGGSIEDLWAFNEMAVAEAIASSHIPIISGVGHETDFTIADFVADVRAATPTAAAQAVVPDRQVLRNEIDVLSRQLLRLWQHHWQRQAQKLDYLQRRLVHPKQRIQQQQLQLNEHQARMTRIVTRQFMQHQQQLTNLALRFDRSKNKQLPLQQQKLQQLGQGLANAYQRFFQAKTQQLATLNHQLAILSPHQVMARGYSIVENQQGDIVCDSQQLSNNQQLIIRFAQGKADVQVIDTTHNT